MRARRSLCLVAAAAVSVGLALVPGVSDASTPSGSAVTRTRTIQRVDLDGGTNHVVDSRTVKLSVSQTTNLRGREELDVSWSGAHPTGNIYTNQNAAQAAEEEYPFVLLECRGTDSTSVPAAKRVTPQTCWTQSYLERFQASYDPFPAWRLDRYATTAQRGAVYGAPSKRPGPSVCNPVAPAEYWVPFTAASGTVYPGGPLGCAGMAPEANDAAGQLDLPSNETFGVTAADGTGQTRFDVFTSAENASLGCSSSVPCSLVAVPILGISCDPAAAGLPGSDRATGDELASATAACESQGDTAPGSQYSGGGNEALSVSGLLWWAASNWRNRLSVPLSFAVSAAVCDVVSNASTVDVYGSELMAQATGQWAPALCVKKGSFRFEHIQTGEPAARILLSDGSVEAAFTSDPPDGGYGRPVVNAPVGVTGFAVSYSIDDAQHHVYSSLRLTPLLLAKLLTESYPSNIPVQSSYAALSHNPLNITDDPEFIALNPGITKGVGASQAASTLLALSGQSDVMYALTSYINADPTARAWLDGKPDPWGMVVNPAYRGIKLPVSSWPLLDSFVPKAWYDAGSNSCLHDNPVPYLPLVASPQPTLAAIAQAVQFSVSESQVVCSQPIPDSSQGEKLVAQGPQTVGYRFVIGITSLGDALRYRLNTAALQTRSAPTQQFVAPSDASLRAATSLLTPDAASGSWNLDYDTLRTSSKGAAAYPGTQVVYMSVPTTGLPTADAHDYADLLRFAATTGQVPGDANGELPAGYLPMTAANGLGGLAAYTLKAADAVASQGGVAPTPTTTAAGGPPSSGGSSGPGSSDGGGTPSASSTPSASASRTPGAGALPPGAVVASGLTRSSSGGAAGLVLPVALVVAVLAGALTPVSRRLARRRRAT